MATITRAEEEEQPPGDDADTLTLGYLLLKSVVFLIHVSRKMLICGVNRNRLHAFKLDALRLGIKLIIVVRTFHSKVTVDQQIIII